MKKVLICIIAGIILNILTGLTLDSLLFNFSKGVLGQVDNGIKIAQFGKWIIPAIGRMFNHSDSWGLGANKKETEEFMRKKGFIPMKVGNLEGYQKKIDSSVKVGLCRAPDGKGMFSYIYFRQGLELRKVSTMLRNVLDYNYDHSKPLVVHQQEQNRKILVFEKVSVEIKFSVNRYDSIVASVALTLKEYEKYDISHYIKTGEYKVR